MGSAHPRRLRGRQLWDYARPRRGVTWPRTIIRNHCRIFVFFWWAMSHVIIDNQWFSFGCMSHRCRICDFIIYFLMVVFC
jgi:hypothetical protein